MDLKGHKPPLRIELPKVGRRGMPIIIEANFKNLDDSSKEAVDKTIAKTLAAMGFFEE